jgi:hypothetical protein
MPYLMLAVHRPPPRNSASLTCSIHVIVGSFIGVVPSCRCCGNPAGAGGESYVAFLQVCNVSMQAAAAVHRLSNLDRREETIV